MGKVKGKQRQDKFYHLAKEQGYRSRAAFKLLQLDAKYRFLPSSRSILDLCAAPGGWLQVAVRHAPVGSFVVGIDLFPIRPIRGAHSLVEDITTPRCRAAIKRLMDSNGCSAFDVVLHDGSPNVGGAWAQEATSQSALVIDALRLATNFLAPKGTFVTKVDILVTNLGEIEFWYLGYRILMNFRLFLNVRYFFNQKKYLLFLHKLSFVKGFQLFEKVEVTKPVASRSTSAEIYVIGSRYKAPAKIDPRLLDVKHLFQGAIEPPKVVDVLRGSKQKRNREGYEEGNTTLWKVGLASDFIWSEEPLEFLGSVNAISFDDPACLSIKDHELTTDEIKSLCEDLYVLDKNSFKHLLKWRLRLRKALSSTEKVAAKTTDAEDDTKGNEDDRLLSEMEELTYALERKKKKTKKRLAKRQAKDKARKAMGMQIDATEDSYFDQDLFSLSSIKGKNELQAIDSVEPDEGGDDIRDSESEETHAAVGHEHSSSEMDSDEEQKRYDEQLEEMLDEAYERYVSRKGGSIKQHKRAKLVMSNDDGELLEGGDDDVIHSDHDSDQDQSDKEKNPLILLLNEEQQPTQEQIMEQWFSQDVFAKAAEEGVFEKSDSEEKGEEKSLVLKKPEKNSTFPKELSSLKTQPSRQDDGFEIVPAEPMETSDDSSSSCDDSEEDDEDTKAEILAYAKKMLRKKQREQILDDAYNKYMFDDEGLPKWFVEEEKQHCQPMKPVTREEIAAMKARFRDIDARPAKKVAEAKARKKRAVMRKMEKARQKANSVADQTDLSERSKRKMIDQIYRKAVPKKPQKEYVVARKGVQIKAGKGKVLVDRRMKKDSRSRGMGRPGKGGSKKVKGAKGKVKGPKGKKSAKSPGKRAGKGQRGSKGAVQG
ncbi:pre-rRNA 2'-O-ribose RNA methyltransferase [Cocos nucifera]|uniref:Putative rRNA methyltransferase n=1 Tax=Cocos nucifera TaxID=13894 RepID=A0A8K0N2S9_COCNU|nr:pre-rRNA 2'-O-ribose RNA methyltransferase [Cocos nucifera]